MIPEASTDPYRLNEATWAGPVPGMGGSQSSIRLFVIHVMQGEDLGGCNSWFHNVAARVSAHFGVGRDGEADQWVQLNEVAWACGEYNEVSISIEHAGFSGQKLTSAQLKKTMAILVALHERHPNVPLQWTEDPNGTGVAPHGCLGVAGGNHPRCPGLPIERQVNKALHKLERGSRVTRMRSVRKVPA